MAAQRTLDRKAKAAIAVLTLVFLGVVILGLRSCIVALTPEQTVAAPDSSKEQLVLVGKETMVVPNGSIGSQIVSWLAGPGGGTRAFEVTDQSFAPGSDEPTQAGLQHFERFAGMMRADSSVKAHLIVPAGNDALSEQLAEKRAARIRTELIARSVPVSRISTEVGVGAGNAATAKQRPIVVVLSK